MEEETSRQELQGHAIPSNWREGRRGSAGGRGLEVYVQQHERFCLADSVFSMNYKARQLLKLGREEKV